MGDHSFGIQEGEIAVELPKQFDACVYFIGEIRTPSCPTAVCLEIAAQPYKQIFTQSTHCMQLMVEVDGLAAASIV